MRVEAMMTFISADCRSVFVKTENDETKKSAVVEVVPQKIIEKEGVRKVKGFCRWTDFG